MKLRIAFGVVFVLLIIQIVLSMKAHAFIEKKVHDCYPNCGRVYPGWHKEKPYFIRDPFCKVAPRKCSYPGLTTLLAPVQGILVADAKPAKAAKPAPTKPPPPPPKSTPVPQTDPCKDHACAGSM